MKHFLFVFLFFLSLNFSISDSIAAEIVVVDKSPVRAVNERGISRKTVKCHIRLSGEIRPGDAKRLKEALSNFPKKPWTKIGLCLDSIGGSFSEGIRIAEMLLGKGLKFSSDDETGHLSIFTYIEKDKKCFSACAIIFMAGHYYELEESTGYLTERYLHVKGKLGFHSPYITLDQSQYDKETVENAYNLAALAVRNLAKLGHGLKVGGFSPNFNFMPQALIIEMLSRGKNEFYKIDTVHKAKINFIELTGFRKPKNLNSCHYNNICGNVYYDHLIGHDKPAQNNSKNSGTCWKNWQSKRRGNQSLLFQSGHGGEALYFCVLRWSKQKIGHLEYYSELVESDKKKLDVYDFTLAPNSYYYPHHTKIEALAR
ncbi:hypothetical protein NBRC116602_28770 [Hyphomicrobiales bacterium 4NK60-0047b]